MIAIPEPPIFSAQNGLRLLRQELNRAILRALVMRPMGVSALCAELMLESDTTLREQLAQFEAVGAVERQPEDQTYSGGFRLTAAGGDLLETTALVGSWLTGRPGQPLSPQSEGAWRAFAALADAWELSLVHHLLLRPSTKAELLTTIPSLSREKAKRMLRRLRGAGLLGLRDGRARAPRYGITVWARRAIAVLAAIAAWERRHLGRTAEPVAAYDGVVALLASLPLIRPPLRVAGICAFTVEAEPGAQGPLAGAVWARVEHGRVTACRSGTSPAPPQAWVRGDVEAWLEAVVKDRLAALHLGGDCLLAEGAVHGLHEELFGGTVPPF